MDNQNPMESEGKVAGAGRGALNAKFFLFGLAGLLLLAVVVTITVICYRVYHSTTTDRFTVTAAKILHLPALKVNGNTVTYSDYTEDLAAIHVMRDFDKQSGGQGASYTDEQLSDQVLWRLANNILISQAAKQYGVTIVDTDVEALKSQVLQQFKTTAEAEAELQKRYGWDLATYEKKVIRPYVLQNKLSDKLSTNPEARTALRNQAQAVLTAIKNGADFATEAKQYGSDSTKDSGGDLGWFGRGDMVPEFENAVFALKKGELSPELIETQYGYHIIKLTDTKTETTKDSAGKSITEQKVRASHILFPFPSLTQYMDAAVKKAEFHLYLNMHDPFAEAKQQLTATTTNQ